MSAISWEKLYETQAPRLLGLCRRYVADSALAEDLMHDAFLIALRKQDSYHAGGPIEAWLRRITLNTVLLHLRKVKKMPELTQSDVVEVFSGEEDDEAPESLRETLLEAGFGASELLEVLDSLPDHHRLVFNLYVMEGYTHRQIAEILGISAGTSKSHLARARKKIRELLLEKVNAMPKKERRAAIFILPFFKQKKHPVDELFQQTLSGFELPGRAPLPEQLAEALKAATAPPGAPVGWGLVVKFLPGAVLVLTLASIGWWLTSRQPIASPGATDAGLSLAPELTVPAVQEIQKDSAREQPPGSMASFSSTVSPASTDDKGASLDRPAKPKNDASNKELPVVVRRQVVHKDTVFQYKAPEESNDE